MTTLALSFRDVQFDVIDRSGQPWLRGYQIGTALEYTNQPDAAIRKIYERNADEFTDAMTALVELETNGGKQQVRIFSLRGCHLLAMLARTPIAKEFRKWVLDILDREVVAPRFRPERTRKALPGKLTAEQQDAIKALVKSRVEALPHEKQAKAAITCWSAIKSKFGVSYKEVPAEHFAEVLSLVARLDLGDAEPKALLNYPLESAAPPLGCAGLGYYAFAQAKDWVDPCWELLMKLKAAGFDVEGPIYSHRAKLHVMTAMYDFIVGKTVESLNGACASLPYAPVYLR